MKKLLHLMKPYKWTAVCAVLFTLMNNICVLYLPGVFAKIINKGALMGDMPYVYKMGGLMLLVAVLSGVTYIASAVFASKVTSSFARDLRRAVFVKAQEYSMSDYQKFGSASLITRCTNDITVIQRSFMMILQMLLPAPIMAVVGLVLAFRTNATMGLVMAAIIGITGGIAFFIGSKAIPLFRQLQVKMDNLTRILREIISGVRVIRAFHREKYEEERFGSSCKDYCDIAIETNKIFAVLLPTLTLLTNLGIICILLFGGVKVSEGMMQIGSIFALIEYLTIILFTVTMAILVFMEIPRAQSCGERLNEVLDLEPEIQDKENALAQDSARTPIRAQLEFRNVSFRYTNAEEAVLNKISFTSKAGETTAIIGGTGSGKSTIANLIPRFFDVDEGEILIDGVDIRNLSQKELRSRIGFIPQKTFLFRGTIASNIRYGKEDASDTEIIQAAKTAQAHTFISSMEKGYDSFVAQGGTNLSGGQKQRIAIARALVRKPEIYVFDDSFSALDYKTDALLRKALRQEIKNKEASLIIVAQRVSSILDADRIIVLDQGEIAGVGTHQELMKSCLAYKQIAASQLSESQLKKEVV